MLVAQQNDRKFISFNFFVKQLHLLMKLFKAGSIKVRTVGVRSVRPVQIFSELWCSDCSMFELFGVRTFRPEWVVRPVRCSSCSTVPTVQTVRVMLVYSTCSGCSSIFENFIVRCSDCSVRKPRIVEQWTPAVRCSVDPDLRTYYEFRDCFIHTESLILRKSI